MTRTCASGHGKIVRTGYEQFVSWHHYFNMFDCVESSDASYEHYEHWFRHLSVVLVRELVSNGVSELTG